MSWRAQIRPASFRGVAFGVTGAGLEAGRRTVLHEFPQRDQPYAEDMGAAPMKFTLEAFVLGSDYLSRRDQLEKALQNPDPGTLVHPWYGEVEVAQYAPYKVRFSAQNGGMCVFSLSFVRAKEPESPSASVNSRLRALLSCDLASALSCDALDSVLSLTGQAEYVVTQSLDFIKDCYSTVASIMGVGSYYLSLGASLFSGAAGLLAGGESFAESFLSALQGLSSGLEPEKAAHAWAQAAIADYSAPNPAHAGSSRQTIRRNCLAAASFIRKAALVESCRAAADCVPASRKSAQALKDAIIDAFDAAQSVPLPEYAAETVVALAIAEPSPESDPALAVRLADAFAEMRGNTLAAIAESARRAPEVEMRTPPAILPALVLCHRFTGSAALCDDLVARNAIVHPGFAPVRPLEVLLS